MTTGGIGGTTIATVPTTGTGTVTTTVPVATPTTTTSTMGSMNAAHGSFALQINGIDVTSATAGQVVKIVANPEAGYKVASVSVLKNNGTETVPVTGMTFVMPDSAITVNVTFTKI